MVYVFICDRIRARREELGFSGRKMAEKAGLPPSSLVRYEKGEREPCATAIGKMAAALGVTPTYFYEKEKT